MRAVVVHCRHRDVDLHQLLREERKAAGVSRHAAAFAGHIEVDALEAIENGTEVPTLTTTNNLLYHYAKWLTHSPKAFYAYRTGIIYPAAVALRSSTVEAA